MLLAIHADSKFLAEEVNGKKTPRTYNEAISESQYSIQWKAAMVEEFSTLISNKTWKTVILPSNTN